MAFTLRRKAARVVLLNRQNNIFLMQASDPIDPYKPSWWEIPGGGMHSGESTADAARRELYEETGITDVEIGPCIWTQHAVFSFGGYDFDQDEFIHVAWCEDATWRPAALEALEAAAFEAARWWGLDELLTSAERLLPAALRDHLPPIVAGDLPAEPIDIG